jgi:hypothetical protein
VGRGGAGTLEHLLRQGRVHVAERRFLRRDGRRLLLRVRTWIVDDPARQVVKVPSAFSMTVVRESDRVKSPESRSTMSSYAETITAWAEVTPSATERAAKASFLRRVFMAVEEKEARSRTGVAERRTAGAE